MERDEEWRALFLSALKTLDQATLYFLDECGIDHRLHRLYGWSSRGTQIFQTVNGSRIGRTNVIAALNEGKLVAPFTFSGPCNTALLDDYLKEGLLPLLPKGSVIVLDNAAFHHSSTTAQLVAETGCSLLFLPTYSPDFNPIERVWASCKSLLRKLLPLAPNRALCIDDSLLSFC